ncbi:MAG TPA: Rossmann fold nucleotide-binding protein [Intrasporangium sp.]|uniref:LOG family protein n=1 Tax=Intrasporangium sp. TaxID=1925024 RepID=UPI002B49849B|nr:Rossmann fold nucleotide-binding protein [Intrasporangium sp.]HKX66943.1 Rossmann fold nucleotide-binding protein [Intrasporangium sp.]
MEIESLDALDDHLADGGSLHGLRLQNLDLTDYAAALAGHSAHGDLRGLVVLGGVVPPDVAEVLHRGGAVVFPQVVGAPVDPWRGLYYPEDLYAGLEHGYAATPDARAYAWSIDARISTDAYATLIRAIHDDTVTDDLDEFVEGRSVVGVMGGHALLRGTLEYAEAAELGRRLAAAGHVVLTGGGPGAMEAANLGAFAPQGEALEGALARLAAVPSFRPEITPWAQLAMEVRHDLVGDEPVMPPDTLGPSASSLGIPTWFYGHEPPNVFCDAVAKYFSNAIREDGILARSNAGVVVLSGAAGTVQEIFQAVTPLYYAHEDEPLPPLVLVGRTHWTETVPVWPALRKLAAGRRMAGALHLVDALDDALACLPSPVG